MCLNIQNRIKNLMTQKTTLSSFSKCFRKKSVTNASKDWLSKNKTTRFTTTVRLAWAVVNLTRNPTRIVLYQRAPPMWGVLTLPIQARTSPSFTMVRWWINKISAIHQSFMTEKRRIILTLMTIQCKILTIRLKTWKMNNLRILKFLSMLWALSPTLTMRKITNTKTAQVYFKRI